VLVSAGDIPGELVVSFADRATEGEISSLIDSYGLEWANGFPINFNQNFLTVYASVSEQIINDAPSLSALIANIKARDAELYPDAELLFSAWPITVGSFKKYGGPVLMVTFNGFVKDESAASFLNSFEDLHVVDVSRHESKSKIGTSGILLAPEGRESALVKELGKNPLVVSIRQNFSVETQSATTTFNSWTLVVLGVVIFCGALFFWRKRKRNKTIKNIIDI